MILRISCFTPLFYFLVKTVYSALILDIFCLVNETSSRVRDSVTGRERERERERERPNKFSLIKIKIFINEVEEKILTRYNYLKLFCT